MSNDPEEKDVKGKEEKGKVEASAQNEENQQPQGKQSTEPASEIQAELSHISGSSVSLAGNNVINFFGLDAQARKFLEELREVDSVRRTPPPPPPDAPLQQKVSHWFHHELKTDREKLFAITLSMFNGLRYSYVKDIHETILHVMYVDEDEKKELLEKPLSRFPDPDNDLISKIKAEIRDSEKSLEEILEFKNSSYASAIFDLMRQHHRDVLLDLLPILTQIVEETRYWEVRYQAALAVAEIGKLDFWWVRSNVLGSWASNQERYVRATVGYSVAHLAKYETSRPSVKTLLSDWTNPNWRESIKTWRYRWTVASAYKEIGTIEADWARDWAYQGLEEVAGFDDIRVADSVIHSLVFLSLQGQLTDILSILRKWLEAGSGGNKKKKMEAPQVRCIVAILAFIAISKYHNELATNKKKEAAEMGLQVEDPLQMIRQSEIEKGEIWPLVVAVGVQSFEYREHRLYDNFFDLIAFWAKHAGDDLPLQNTICHLLVEVYSRVNPYRKKHICNRLEKWSRQKKDEHLAKMATSARDKIECWRLRRLPPTVLKEQKVILGN